MRPLQKLFLSTRVHVVVLHMRGQESAHKEVLCLMSF